MNVQILQEGAKHETRTAVEIARSLGKAFAARAGDYDATDTFAAENFREIKAAGLLSAGIPAELGGGNASYRELCDMLRETARHCSGTALALAMHTHPIAAAVWRWRKGDKAPVEGLLKRVAAEKLMLLSTGGNDWLSGSGTAEKAEGGYYFSGRKRFVSGAEAGDILMTMACDGDTVLHAGVPMKSEGIRIEQTWRTLGMRASGSQDVVLEKVFVPEASIAVRRPTGVWHPFFHLVSLVAWPLIYSVYRGVAEKLRDETVSIAMRRRQEDDTQLQIGALDTALAVVAATHEQMLALGETATPAEAVSASMMTLKRAMTEQMLSAANMAMDAAGGSAFYRVAGIEKLFRDIQAARYHPLTMQPQRRLAGRMALGFTADGAEPK
jgi:alkylation response protein AidB-like acyl-CoA dehydrogenase